MADPTAPDRPDDDSPDTSPSGAESPEEGAAAQHDADEAADTDSSPTGKID
ncbi:MAG: hypothetical protein J0I95_03545 [Microbacterium sp.]|uniref:hypothetical protein n=1 Tax=unclassified Microbacterium TaxID=2609290 RepID=UPI001ACE1B20|nr:MULTISPECIES: hypothetical protein [unclassified Microbacterium]MBN9210577.1 hypothetical protein [Microbacterium sp.]